MNRVDIERLRAIAAALPIPAPWNLDGFLHSLSKQRGRPIQLRPLEGPSATAHTPTGLWVPGPEADHIFYETQTSKPHQDHIVCHELSHMILRHQRDPQQPGHYLNNKVFAELDPALVASARARTSYGFIEEREAETLATIILGEEQMVSPHHHTDADASAAQRWDPLLGFGS